MWSSSARSTPMLVGLEQGHRQGHHGVRSIGDYKDGYSLTAAPQIVKGMLITGNSGGEFGVVGRVDARDPLTGKLIWTRPVVEGHMGLSL
jgi:hypothetical protein